MKTKSLFALSLLAAITLSGCNAVYYTYEDADKYTKYTEPVDIVIYDENLRTLDLDWISGQIYIQRGNMIRIEEEPIRGNYHPLYYYLDGLKLNVKYCASMTKTLNFNYSKKLVVTIPNDLELINIKTISADYHIDLNKVDNIKVKTTSGDGEVNVSTIGSFEKDTTSGDIAIDANKMDNFTFTSTSGDVSLRTNTIKDIHFKSTSGNFYSVINSSLELNQIWIKTTSGNSTLNLDGVRGYNLDFTSGSGDKDLEFRDGSDPTLSKFDIVFKSTSGDLKINKISN